MFDGNGLAAKSRHTIAGHCRREALMASKTQRFRQLIEINEIPIQPGVYDASSASFVQQMGFRSAAISGAGLSERRLRWVDVGLMGFEDMEQRFLTPAQKQAKYRTGEQ
jgi:hypothetical protein